MKNENGQGAVGYLVIIALVVIVVCCLLLPAVGSLLNSWQTVEDQLPQGSAIVVTRYV